MAITTLSIDMNSVIYSAWSIEDKKNVLVPNPHEIIPNPIENSPISGRWKYATEGYFDRQFTVVFIFKYHASYLKLECATLMQI